MWLLGVKYWLDPPSEGADSFRSSFRDASVADDDGQLRADWYSELPVRCSGILLASVNFFDTHG